MFKIMRVFFGGYTADNDKLVNMLVTKIQLHKPVLTILDNNQGFGRVEGITRKAGANYSPVPVCVFRRDNRRLLWETKSKTDGSYVFRNIAVGLECFVVAFDPNEEYNAVISDKVVAK